MDDRPCNRKQTGLNEVLKTEDERGCWWDEEEGRRGMHTDTRPLRWELQLHTTGGWNCPTGGAVGQGHCSMAAASPTLVIKGISRIQTDKKMASDTTYYLITQRPGGDRSRKWNINENAFHMHCTCHPLSLILKTPSAHNPVQSVTGNIVFSCSNLHLGVKQTITNRVVSSAKKRTQKRFYRPTFCLVC